MSLMQNDFMWAEGMELLRQSVALNPNNAELLSNYGIYLQRLNMEGSEAILDRAFRLDPYGLWPIIIRTINLHRNGRSLDAARVMETSLIGDPNGYVPNINNAMFSLLLGAVEKAEEYIGRARQVAHPVDLCLDMQRWAVDFYRRKDPITGEDWEILWRRATTEHACGIAEYALLGGLEGEQALRAFDLMIEQRHNQVAGILFGPRPPQIPEADWQRMKEVTGVAEFQSRQGGQILIDERPFKSPGQGPVHE